MWTFYNNAGVPKAGAGLVQSVSAVISTYTWATLPITKPRGSYAFVADSISSVAGSWLLEYRDDLDASYPWRVYGGSTGAPITVYVSTYAINSTGWQQNDTSNNAPSIGVPAAGHWGCGGSFGGGTTNGAGFTAGFGVSTSSSVAPTSGNYVQTSCTGGTLPTDVTTSTLAPVDFLLAKNATVYSWWYLSANASKIAALIAMSIAPIKVAGNV